MQFFGIEVLYLQQSLPHAMRPLRVFAFNRAPNHHCNHVASSQLRGRLGVNHMTITHDSNHIAVLKNFIELMTDVDN